MNNFQECALKTFENTFTAEDRTYKDVTQKSDDDLRGLIEKNKTLKQKIDIKLKELQHQQKQYETFKQVLSTNPQLKNIKELQRKLQDTNDVPGILSCIRKSFLTIKDSTKR
ncbi:hypothetical protein RR46_10010 [Papilio xuthus]|uniref:Kinetochore protein SPC25 n=1 Tax=Papilio xuthus TaxID=66420 RepID=A0A194QBH1_PAPXU|nr:hypothetical protein RR46_10010 [Papilio xuthus]